MRYQMNKFCPAAATTNFNAFVPTLHCHNLIFTALDNRDEKVLSAVVGPWLKRLKDSVNSVGELLYDVDYDSRELVLCKF